MVKRKTRNYLNNHDLLIQIHKSKCSYCIFDDEKFKDFDQIIYDPRVLTDDDICSEHFGEAIIITKENKEVLNDADIYEILDDEIDGKTIKKVIKRKTVEQFINEVKEKRVKRLKKLNENDNTQIEDIDINDLVFRYMTFDHIPHDEEWPEDKEKKKASDGYVKVNFPPFQHLVFDGNNIKVVGKSHYKSHNEFSSDHGQITNKLGSMFMLLVEKISKKHLWVNYTYLDEMVCSALLQLSQVGLQFDEGRGQIPNPFAFYTTIVTNVFRRILNNEKKIRNLRDDLIELENKNPSFTRQMESMDSYD